MADRARVETPRSATKRFSMLECARAKTRTQALRQELHADRATGKEPAGGRTIGHASTE